MTTEKQEKRLVELRSMLKDLKDEYEDLVIDMHEIEDEIYEIEHPDEYPPKDDDDKQEMDK